MIFTSLKKIIIIINDQLQLLHHPVKYIFCMVNKHIKKT